MRNRPSSLADNRALAKTRSSVTLVTQPYISCALAPTCSVAEMTSCDFNDIDKDGILK